MSAQDSVASPPQGLETVSVKRPGFLASVARDKKAVVGIVILTILVLRVRERIPESEFH